MKLMPGKDMVAKCQHGIYGIIETDKPDKNRVWHGVCIDPRHKDKESWQSNNPEVICHVEDLIDVLSYLKFKARKKG